MNKQGTRTEESLQLRKEGGQLLKTIRQHRGLTQRDVAVALDLKYYTMIAQIESGAARIPPDHFVGYAKVLSCNPQLFIRKMMAFHDPVTYAGLWGNEYIPMTDLMDSDA